MKRPQAMNSHELHRLIIDTFGGGPTSSGISINSNTALRLITVQNCVRVRAATIAQLPCHIMERNGNMRNKAEDFYLYEKLHDQPNSWMTAPEFWGMVEAHICLRGNFYAYKMGLPGRPILEIIPLKADAVTEVIQAPDYKLYYKVQVQKSTATSTFDDGHTSAGYETITLPQEKIMHIRGLTLNGYMGINPIQYARESIGIGLASEKFLAQYFGKGLHPSAVIKHPLTLNAPAHANLKQALKEKYATLANAQDFMLIDEGMSIEFPQIKLVDAQYLELMKMNEAQICGLFRVPLMLVQAGDKAPTYASAEQFMLAYSVYGVTPDCVNYEKAIRRDLLTPEEQKKYYAKFNIDSLLRGDFKTRMEGFQIAIDKEIMNPNEVRDLMEMNPYKGGEIYKTRTATTKDASSNEGVQK